MTARRSSSAALLAGILLAGCVTPDSLMKAAMSRGGPDEEKEASNLAAYASEKSHPKGLRAWALRADARLKRQPEEALEKVGKIVADPSEDPAVRAWAAYALGEFRKSSSLPHFRNALNSSIDASTGYFTLEGLAKVLPAIVQNPDVNDQIVSGMSTFAAHQKKFAGDIYDLVSGEATNLRLLSRMLERAKPPKDGLDDAETYTVVYQTLNHIARPSMKNLYTLRFEDNQTALVSAITRSFDLVTANADRTRRMVSWYAGVIGDSDRLGNLCSTRVAAMNKDEDPRLRFLTTWSLQRMEVANQDAAGALASDTLRHETDEKVLRLLGAMSNEKGQPDVLQAVLKVRVNPVASTGE